MSWFKVDDGFHSSRKVLSIPKRTRWAAIGVWSIAGSWCADQLTDGFVPGYMLTEWGTPPAAADALVAAGLWEVTSGGYAFRKWAEYQPSKADVDAERTASRERMRNIRAARKGAKPREQADPEGVFGRTGPNRLENVRNPDPTRPDPVPDSTPSGVESPLPPEPENSPEPTGRNIRENANHGSRIVHAFLAKHPDVAWPSKVKSDLMAQATVSVQDGIPDDVIGRALDLWHDGGYPASTLPTSIMQAQRAASGAPPPGGKVRRPSPSERAAATLALADQLEGTDQHGITRHRESPREIADRR